MTWKKLFKTFKGFFEGHMRFLVCGESENQECNGKGSLVSLKCGHKNFSEFIQNHSLDILYSLFAFITHAYFVVILLSFFLQSYIPHSTIRLADSLSDPYLGIIGIYLVLKEVRIRTGTSRSYRVLGEVFVVAWVLLLFTSTVLTFVSESYHVDDVYKLIVTNSLASVIIRIGTLFKY